MSWMDNVELQRLERQIKISNPMTSKWFGVYQSSSVGASRWHGFSLVADYIKPVGTIEYLDAR